MQKPHLEALIVPVGGWFAGGNCRGRQSHQARHRIDRRAIQPVPGDGSIAQTPNYQCGQYTVAEGIAVKGPGRLTSKIISDLANDIILVDEND